MEWAVGCWMAAWARPPRFRSSWASGVVCLLWRAFIDVPRMLQCGGRWAGGVGGARLRPHSLPHTTRSVAGWLGLGCTDSFCGANRLPGESPPNSFTLAHWNLPVIVRRARSAAHFMVLNATTAAPSRQPSRDRASPNATPRDTRAETLEARRTPPLPPNHPLYTAAFPGRPHSNWEGRSTGQSSPCSAHCPRSGCCNVCTHGAKHITLRQESLPGLADAGAGASVQVPRAQRFRRAPRAATRSARPPPSIRFHGLVAMQCTNSCSRISPPPFRGL